MITYILKHKISSLIFVFEYAIINYDDYGRSEYLITSNIKDFKNAQLKGFEFNIVTPGEFYKLWKSRHE